MASSSISCIIYMIFGVLVALGAIVFQADARAFFVFGDSLVDSGNNNYLFTIARADSPPYGIDYPTHTPTGRFSNGLNLPDIISEHIGSEHTLPYLSPELRGKKLLIGANFGSAGIGILNDTGIQFLNIIRIGQQLNYFKQYQKKLSTIIGKEGAKKLVKESLVLIALGGNDFVNNYFFTPFSIRSQQYSLPDYVKLLISEYRKILLRLHEMGPRRILVTGSGPIGCVPAELARRGGRNGKCATELQRAASLFNPQLVKMLTKLNKDLGSLVFIGTNAIDKQLDFINNPRAYGFVTSKIACCGQGPYNGLGLCTPFSNLCTKRDKYAFWDAFHPSEKANRLIVQQIMSGSEKYMTPMNLSTIMDLDSRV